MPPLADYLGDRFRSSAVHARNLRPSAPDRHPSSFHSEKSMPYRVNADLPASVRDHLPPHAQDIYRAAFNHAFASHAGEVRKEEIAHRTAWAAVKRSYVKDGDSWVPRNL
jgi:cation transport regulator